MGRRKKKSKQAYLDSTVQIKPISKDFANLPQPRYLVISRDHPLETLIDVPSSLLTNVINNVAGKVNSIKRQKDGTILIETKTETQSAKLAKLKYFPPKVPVRVTPHRWLNYSRGVIKYLDIGCDSALEDMKTELRSQSVVDVKPIMTKSIEKDICTTERKLSYILTFSLPTLPKFVNIGYFVVSLVPYVPQPKMCYLCYQYGHISKYCKSEKQLCSKCVQPNHDAENCPSATICANCSQEVKSGHTSCLGYMLHRKIMEIDSILKNVNLDA